MNPQGSGVARSKTMTGIVGGELVLPVVWKCRKTRPKPRPLCPVNRAKLLQSDRDQKTFSATPWPAPEIWPFKSP